MAYDEQIENKILTTIRNLTRQSPWDKVIIYNLLLSNLDKNITSNYDVRTCLSRLHTGIY